MSTELQDLTNYDGEPVILYEFYRQSTSTLTGAVVTTYYRYTSSDRDWVDADGNVFATTAISDDGIRQSGDTTADQLTVTLPYTAGLPQLFVGSPPSDPIVGSIRHANVGETDTFLVWAGLVGGVSRSQSVTSGGTSAQQSGPGSAQAQVLCNTIGATMDRSGLRLSWSRGCPLDLYGFVCKADPKSFVVSGMITALDGVSIVVAETQGIGPSSNGPITTVRINNPGFNYALHDTGIITGGEEDGTYEVLLVDLAGNVEELSFTPGSHYTPGTGVPTSTAAPQAGVGIGLSLNITVTLTGGSPSFNGGFVEWTGTDGHANRLGVIGFDTSTGRLTILGTTDRLTFGTLVHCFLGCDHTRTMCENVFNNIDNHGGNDYMPDQNPFNGDLIF